MSPGGWVQKRWISITTTVLRLGKTYEDGSGNEIPLDGRLIGKQIHIHPEEAREERQGEEDEGDPAEPPQAGVEFKRQTGVSNGDRLVHLERENISRYLGMPAAGLSVGGTYAAWGADVVRQVTGRVPYRVKPWWA